MTNSPFSPEILTQPRTGVNPRLSIVGAGPGDPELITLKAIKALQNADVVLYDALVDPSLLEYAPQALHRFVGKRAGQHYLPQDAINQLIVESAMQYGHVVRLKGGDPFIFGRGQEELEFAAAFDIAGTYIPGISSSIAVPGLVGIPLTTRGTNESFWVTTGTTSCGVLSTDIPLAAQSSATVVILMGIGKLSEIVQIFKQYRAHDLPVAVIQNGSTVQEKAVFSSLESIEEVVCAKAIGAPAIIVLGETVALRGASKSGTELAHVIHQ
jgi:uroporphyrin-III C-methyltransferase